VGSSRARAIGERARRRLLRQHTYAARASLIEAALQGQQLEVA
jgi:hypothetical protein